MAEPTSLFMRKVLRAPRARVFEAWRDPTIMARWFAAPGWIADVSSEFRVGGHYRIHMRDDAGQEHLQFGEYVTIEPESRLVFTWTCHELGVTDSVVTVELHDRGDETELVLTHVLPPDPETVRLHRGGWERCLGQLAIVVAEPQQETP